MRPLYFIILFGIPTLLITMNVFFMNESETIPFPLIVNRVYVVLAGRLGNQLFNLAGTYGIAKINHRVLVIPPKFVSKIKSFLNITHLKMTIHFESAEPPENVALCKFRSATYEEKMEHLEDKDLKLGLHVQSFKYFQPYISDIKNMMVIRDDLVHQAQSFLNSFNCSQTHECTFIAIHIRRGDNVSVHKQKHGLVIPKLQYLKKAISYFINKYTNVHFILCSDDIKWCRNNERKLKPGGLHTNIDYRVHFCPSFSPEFDLALLIQCNHTIITTGTYGWWAGWLAGGEVIYFDNPKRNGSNAAKHFTAQDYFAPTWIGMDDD